LSIEVILKEADNPVKLRLKPDNRLTGRRMSAGSTFNVPDQFR
jgi:hypothetical protein